MSSIYGAVKTANLDKGFLVTQGQSVIYEWVGEILSRTNSEISEMVSVFTSRDIEDYKLRYKLPGNGRMARAGEQSQGPAVKTTGSWDVAFPIYLYREQIAIDAKSVAYMNGVEFQAEIDGITKRYLNEVRWQILHRLLDNVQESFTDPLYGSLNVEPLANGDTVVYPPVIGSDTEAVDDHYIPSTYTAANISDTNNPFITLEDEVTEHFGKSQGSDNVIVFIHPDQTAKTANLTAYVPLSDRFVKPGDDTATLLGAPANVPGRIIGRVSGCWVSEWEWMPTGYMLAIHLAEEKPLMRRVESAPSLPRGLALIAKEGTYPFEDHHFEARYGYGAGNRLNGAVMFFTSGSSYTVPASYT